MNVYDTANRLAQEIKASEEYKAYKQAKEDIMATPEPVSYTHLDVYKRQVAICINYNKKARKSNYCLCGNSHISYCDL